MTGVPSDRPLAIIAGTTVPEVVGGWRLGPLAVPRVPVASLCYRQFEQLAVLSRTFGLGRLGFVHSRSSFEALEPRIDRFVSEGPADLLGDSQGGYVAVEYAFRHPERIRNLVLLSTPLSGTKAAWIVDTPGTRCMRPHSRYAREVREKLRQLVESPDGPTVTCISSGHDYLVPYHSAFLHDEPRVRNLCLNHIRPDDLHELVELIEVWDGHFRWHVSEIFLRHTARVVGEILTGQQSDPDPEILQGHSSAIDSRAVRTAA